DPHSDGTGRYFDTLSMVYFDAGQYDEGLEAARKVVATYPDDFWGYVAIAGNAVRVGRIDEARAAVVEARRLKPNLSRAMIRKATGQSSPEIEARWNVALGQAGLD